MVNVLPDIPDTWRGGQTDTARILGITRKTLDRYTAMGARQGGINHHVSKANGRRYWLGKDIKRFFYNLL